MVLLLAIALLQQTTPLQAFVDKIDGGYALSAGAVETAEIGTVHNLRLRSQIWQGKQWVHDLELYVPARNDFPGKALLIITGDRGPADRDMEDAWKIVELARCTVAVLYDVPNQPLLDGLREDDLIAVTFGEFLKTEDDNWPLLFPMVKSAAKAMEAITSYSQLKLEHKVSDFVVSGASKRGWTTYLTAAIDKRVIGIAPMVFDFLDFPRQLELQSQMWGRYSPMLGPYTSRGLPDLVSSPGAQRLLDRVDPWRYRDRLTMPKLIILGSNDEYWPINAITLYWDRLPGSKSVLYVPNSGHGLGDKSRVHGSLAAFTRATMSGRPMPNLTWNWILTGSDDSLASSSATLMLRAPGATQTAIWLAESEDRDFSKSNWTRVSGAASGGQLSPPAPRGQSGFRALFGEAEYEIEGVRCWVSTTPVILKGR
ncbi:MAG: hypothetical protein KIT74_04710 [Fimbriimonadales bacterium]|nr:hypothetical protein [Fimbriimonadales bacterium]